jgi:hypothetical protein
VSDGLERLIDEWLDHYIGRFAASDIELAARVRWAMRHATVVGGPRDGDVVSIVGLIRYEPMPARMYDFAAIDAPTPLGLRLRRYRLQRFGKPFALDDPLQSHTSDLDLDPTYGNRYVLDTA